MDKIVITSDELLKPSNTGNGSILKNQPMPLWWRVLSALFILFPPVLLLIIIFSFIINRDKNLSVKYSYTFHYCILLIVSGIIWFFIWALLSGDLAQKKQLSEPSAIPVSIHRVPKLPPVAEFSGKEIAFEFLPMVIAIHNTGITGYFPNGRVSGAGVIIAVLEEGCLILTSRHITDALTDFPNEKQVVSISKYDGQQSFAKVIGVHKAFDLSLLWAYKTEGDIRFLQPVRDYNTIEVGESVFVIGHPKGLAFSISNGLVSQKRDEVLLQISAPVSPGNSGGPVFDAYGNLIAIVQSVTDKTKEPNAENLNFAVRADALMQHEDWLFTAVGETLLSVFLSNKDSAVDDIK